MTYDAALPTGRYIFLRAYNKEADAWAGKGARGREKDLVDIANVVWPEVIGMCRFWGGRLPAWRLWCRYDDQDFHHKKCGPVPRKNSLGAEIGGCAMLRGNLNQLVNKICELALKFYGDVSCPLYAAFFGGMLRLRVDRNRASHTVVVLWVSGGSGVRCLVVRVLRGRGSGVQSVT